MAPKPFVPLPSFARWTFIVLILASLACAGWFLVNDLYRVAYTATEFRILPPFGASCMMSGYALILAAYLYIREVVGLPKTVRKPQSRPHSYLHPDNWPHGRINAPDGQSN